MENTLAKKNKTGAENIKWDLSDLYESADSKAFKKDRDDVVLQAKNFASRYKGKIAELDAVSYKKMLQEYESILDTIGKIGSFSYLRWSTNTGNATYGKLVQESNELSSEVNQLLVFLDVEWLAMDNDKAKQLIEHEELAFYRHYLEASRRYKDHILDEGQEQVLSAKSVTGKSAWNRFFDETLGRAKFELDGEQLSEQEVLSKLHESDRQLRKRAHASLTHTFRELSHPLTFIFNTILADKYTNDKLRNYPSWITSRNLANETNEDTVNSLVEAVTGNYSLVQRYYKLKRDLLGLDELYDYDRYAPLVKSDKVINWEQAREMVLESYSEFHPEMGKITQKFFDNNWIDAAIAKGKRGGAYSASTVPSVHPYVFMNYDGKVRDVQTLAHELGHGVHQYLSKDRGVLQSGTPLTTAETASVFGEMLVFQNLLKKLDDPKEKLALLVGKIDDTIATVFRQISMNRFEHAIHTARREQGELTTEEFSIFWRETQKDLYGDSVALTKEYEIWWSYIPHFLHTPGYVYAYAFGELLVLALYEEFREHPDGFQDKYLNLLRAGGSEWPHKLVSKMGLNIQDPEFWNKGLSSFKKMVDEAEALAKKIKR